MGNVTGTVEYITSTDAGYRVHLQGYQLDISEEDARWSGIATTTLGDWEGRECVGLINGPESISALIQL